MKSEGHPSAPAAQRLPGFPKFVRLAALSLFLAVLGHFLPLSSLGSPSAEAAACTISWNAAVDGLWSDATKWSGGVVPGASDDVCITQDGSYTVTLQGSRSVRSVTLGAATGRSTLQIQSDGDSIGPATLTVASGFTNAGVIRLTSSGICCASRASALVVSSGTLLNSSAGSIVVDGSDARTLTAELDNQGTLEVHVSLTLSAGTVTNAATGNVNVTGGTLTLSGASPSFAQSGTMTIASAAAFVFNGGTFTQYTGTLTTNGSFTLRDGAFTWNGGSVTGNLALTRVALTLGVGVGGGSPVFTLLGPCSLAGDVPAGVSLRIQSDGDSIGPATLTVASGFTNAGVIRLTSSGICCASRASALVVSSGTLLNSSAGSIVVDGSDARTLTAELDNQGTLEVHVSLTLGRGPVTNGATGVIRVTAGTLTLSGAPTSVSNSGTITVASGAALAVGGTSPSFMQSGGTLTTNGGFTLSDGTFTQTGGSITAPGGTLAFRSATVDLRGGTLDGSSQGVTVVVVSSELNRYAGYSESGVATITVQGNSSFGGDLPPDVPPGHTLQIQSDGDSIGPATLTVASGFTNAGVIRLTSSGICCASRASALVVSSGTLLNSSAGSIVVDGSDARTLTAELDNQGSLTVGPGVTLNLSSAPTNFSGGTLSGGAYELAGTLKFPGAVITTNAATLALDGAGSAIVNESSANALAGLASNAAAGSLTVQNGRTLSMGGAFSNAGSVAVNSGSALTVNGGYTQTAGSTLLSGGALTASSPIAIQGGSLSGSGTVNGSVTNAGQVSPGGASTTGILTITGGYTQSAAATLTVRLGGTAAGTQHDRLAVSGAATLDGTLAVQLVNDFVPTNGNSFQILSFGSRSGAFATMTGLSYGAAGVLAVSFTPTTLVLTAGTAVPKMLVFTTQPIRGAHGILLGFQPVVAVKDAEGNTFADDNATDVTLVIAQGGAAGAALSCTQTSGGITHLRVAGGVAVFTECKLDLPGVGYILEATASGATAGRTAAFNISWSGDADGDCRVSVVDYSLVVTYFGKTHADAAWTDPAKLAYRADLNGDGQISALDYSIEVTGFGQTTANCAPASNGNPHPTS